MGIFLILIQGIYNSSFAQNDLLYLYAPPKVVDIDRVWEASFIKDYGDTEGYPNQSGFVDTSLLVSSDDKYLYFISLYYTQRDIVKFSWTNDVKTMNVDPSPNDIELRGELVNKKDRHDLMLFRTPRPKQIKPKLIKIADEPKFDDDVYIVPKAYNQINRINRYNIKDGVYLSKRVDTQDLEQYLFKFKAEYQSAPIGGGIVFNSNGALLGIIRTCSVVEQTTTISAISGKSIEKFIRKLQENKDAAPTAPKEKTD